jgi:micrococcal nuclease
MKRLSLVLIIAFSACLSSSAFPHPGALDSNCGHYDRKTGEYHFHKDWKNCRKVAQRLVTVSTVTGYVTKIKDGDTVVIRPLDGSPAFTCRLYGIDTPETPKRGKPGQRYGIEAAQELAKLIKKQTVTVRLTGDKTYGREVCLIEYEGLDVNLEMVKKGYAWAYREYLKSPYASEYIEAERQARAKGLGLWQNPNPEPPWEYRKRYR